MQLQKLFKTPKPLMAILFIGMALTPLLEGCTSTEIKDSTWWGSLGPNGAVQFQMLSDGEKDLSLLDWAAIWNDLKNTDGPVACTRTSTIANLKGSLEKLCSWNPNQCTVDIKTAIKQVGSTMDKVQSKARGGK